MKHYVDFSIHAHFIAEVDITDKDLWENGIENDTDKYRLIVENAEEIFEKATLNDLDIAECNLYWIEEENGDLIYAEELDL